MEKIRAPGGNPLSSSFSLASEEINSWQADRSVDGNPCKRCRRALQMFRSSTVIFLLNSFEGFGCGILPHGKSRPVHRALFPPFRATKLVNLRPCLEIMRGNWRGADHLCATKFAAAFLPVNCFPSLAPNARYEIASI